MKKSPQAFRTISEVAETLDIPAHVLRFWESRFPQLRPMKSSGGRRYYRPDDVDLLRGIRELLYEDGMTIKGVQKIFREQGQRAVIDRGRTKSADEMPTKPDTDTADAQPARSAAAGHEELWDDNDLIDDLEPQAGPKITAEPRRRASAQRPADGAALPAEALAADALPADALPADALPADALPAAERLTLIEDAIGRLESVRARILRELDD
ncbi:MAG: MerR family transcriptional regulator [Pseudomonadota bacterium]